MLDQREELSTLSDDDFNYICQFVYDNAGIVLNNTKREMVYRRLTRIIRERDLHSFSAYCQLLREQSEKERNYFINTITTNLTSFFREQHHFDYISQHELPRLFASTNSVGCKVRIWSCASSTGEEPYSIAISLLEVLKEQLALYDVKILATDIDSDVLAVAKSGIYNIQAVDDIPIRLRKLCFYRGKGANLNKIKVTDKLRSLITFKQLNLLHDWPIKQQFNIVFCRNVIIYFDADTQQKLLQRYYQILLPGGLLILGHSEKLGRCIKHYSHIGRTMYRKES